MRPRLSPISPRPPAIAAAGAPIASSIGCERISTALTPSCTVFASVSSALIVRAAPAAEVVGHVQADLHAGPLRVRLRLPAGEGFPGQQARDRKRVSISFPSSRRV